MNKKVLIIIGIVVAFIIFITGIFVSTNNRAISLEEQILLADSDVQVQEKRRTDLIYNLADCVKEYDKHEAETLLAVVNARNDNTSDINANDIANQISVIAEAYPELKSNDTYKELMNELAITENKIAESRNSYNNQIRSYNKYVRRFPHKQILGLIGYDIIDYNYLEYSESDRQPISNLFEE